MFYHASNIKDLKVLKPHVSMHGKSLVYFSDKKENVLVYLSNAVEKYIKEKHNRPLKQYKKWATYGFTKEGVLCLEEYYPSALKETYKGVKGYIYCVENLTLPESIKEIKNVVAIDDEVEVSSIIEIEDAYEEILKAEQDGRIVISRFEDMTEKKREFIKNMMINEFNNSENEDYKEFLIAKFDWMKECFQKK